MSHQEGSSGNVLAAFLIGAVAGAAVALLYAPAPGDETRRRLSEKAREGRVKAETLARDGREFLQKQRQNVATAVERGKDAFNKARQEPS